MAIPAERFYVMGRTPMTGKNGSQSRMDQLPDTHNTSYFISS